jgi:diguanylate cyclase (GGDEF)-like protein
MPTLVETLNLLHSEFARSTAGELPRLQELVSLLEREPGDREALDELMRAFHGLAGGGGTFGFPEISALGAEGENELSRLLAESRPPDASDCRRMTRLIAAVRGRVSAEAVAAVPAAAPVAEPAREPGQAQGDVLVVADETTHRSLAPLLHLAGFTVRLARSESAARVEMAAALPDVLVADAELPEGSGYRLADFLRQLPRGDEAAILLLGPAGGPCDRSSAIYFGADGVVDRPIDWSDLARQLGQLRAGRANAGRILAVEDDPHHAAFIRAVLEAEGYEVRICADPNLFAGALDSFRPHLVLMDVLLPGTTGYELVRTLRRDDHHATLPVLFLTTEGQTNARIEVVRAGGDDHLVKPVASQLLITAVGARLERGRLLHGLLEHDGLTGLLTQTAFLARARAIAAHREGPAQNAQNAQRVVEPPPVWAMIDLDRFKTVNDRYGHPAGDRVLSTVAAFLRRHVRRGDVVGRYGGEELALLFAGLSTPHVVRLVDRLRRECAQLAFPAPVGPPFQITWSAGVAALRPGMSWEDWREAADQALYAAKLAGRNRVELAAEAGMPDLPAALAGQAARSRQQEIRVESIGVSL